MTDWHWQIALLASAVAFAALLIFKMRPVLSEDGRASAAILKEARQRIEATKDDVAKAKALADAGDACARLGQANGAVGFYLRAFRADPKSAEIVERAATALARRPATLEHLLWRHLGAEPWTGETKAASLAALRALAKVYAKKPRNHMKASAIEHALAALGSPSDAGSPKV